MSEWVEITLPYPPSVNTYWRHTRDGRHYISEKGKAFQASCKQACEPFKLIKGNVSIDILMFPPDKRKRDVDNILKALLDGLTHSGIIEDDSLIVDLRVRKQLVVRDGGMIRMRIEAVV
ncbi:RusA family crossover junction endodeoxyribonuclease [Lonepinella sp. BR2474]|uniref:RusA family crossover junction endodeoxyribonuclease n=1 Tax=Lonepinella sp. BR2474 TaxID=3434548 RepID=UPI003F6E1517